MLLVIEYSGKGHLQMKCQTDMHNFCITLLMADVGNYLQICYTAGCQADSGLDEYFWMQALAVWQT